MREINLRTDAFSAGCAQKILRAGEVHFRNNGTNAGEARVAPIRKKHGLIKRAAYIVFALTTIHQSYASLDSPLARIGAAQQCIAGNSLIIKTVNTPLYTQLGSNFDCIHEHLEQAIQEIIAWRDELYLRHPELLYPEFYAYLAENNITVAELSAQPLTRVLIDVNDADDVGTDIETLFLVKNYVPAGFNLANFVNLKTLALFDGTMTDALRTTIQNLAKQQNVLETIIIPSWGPSISNSAFENATSLIDLYGFKNVTTLGSRCFLACSNLRTLGTTLNEIKLNTISIGGATFKSCTSILTVILPNVTFIPDEAFKSCTALTSVNCPLVTNFAYDSFCYCTSLLIADCSEATRFERGVFFNCFSLKKFKAPVLTYIGDWCFTGAALTSVECSLVTSIGVEAFAECKALQSCNLGALTFIGSNAFHGCALLNPIPSITL
jgi:hypothetical protein